jgi:hypothetical protein
MSSLRNSSLRTPNRPAEPLGQSDSHPTEEAALLITCLRELPCDIPEDTNWEILLGLAEQNGVLLLLYRSLLALEADMPGFFRDAAQECRAVAESLGAKLEALLYGFAGDAIEVLPLKGPALALALYGDAALRQSNDVDLLVRRDDFPRAEALLLGWGFTALGAPSEHDRRFLRGGLLVELHFELASPRFFPFDIDNIWSRSRLIGFRGRPARALSNFDLALYLCAHGLKHGFSRLIWILDLARALQGLEPREYRELIRHAQRRGMRPWLFIGCEVVRTMFPQQLPVELDALMVAYPKALRRARLAVARLFSADQQVVVNDYRVFYLQAEPNPFKRWCYRLRYLAPTYTDDLWARQRRISPGLMIVLRPFRLLEKYGLSRAWQILFPFKA